MTTFKLLLLPLLVAGTLGTAHATSTASASTANYTFSLIDLAPDDGIAPSLTWLNSPGRPLATSNLSINDAISGEIVQLNNSYGMGDLPLDLKTATENGQVQLKLSGTDLASLAQGANASFNGAGALNNSARGSTSAYYGFTLSPNTSLTINTDVDLRVTTTEGSLLPERWESAYATVNLGLEEYRNGEFVMSMGTGESLAAYFLDPQDLQSQRTLSLTFDNRALADSTLYFSSYVGASGISVASTVPEPSSWIMMLLGASVVSVAGARRARRGKQE